MTSTVQPLSVLQEYQEHTLVDAIEVVKRCAFELKRSMDNLDLDAALSHCYQMLAELRNSSLTPKDYYFLYMQVLDELRYMETYLSEYVSSGTSAADLYEKVQQCAAVLPRLYLLITVGSVYIKTKEAPARDILRDLMEMVKSIQHPARGLFVRNYLTTISKDKLPDVGGEYEGFGGTVKDSIDILLKNFEESNRLWIRVLSQAPPKNKVKAEQDRQDLRLLVGSNLVRISQLEGVNIHEYSDIVLPRILEQIVVCKDKISQVYLMDCLLQVFPDVFHIQTLSSLLTACQQLRIEVEVFPILVPLVNRLSKYLKAEGSSRSKEAQNIFDTIFDYSLTLRASRTLDSRPKLALPFYGALSHFALKNSANPVACLDKCHSQSVECMAHDEASRNDPVVSAHIEAQLNAAADNLGLKVLDLAHHASLMAYLPWSVQRSAARRLLRRLLDENAKIDSPSLCDKVFHHIQPLMRDDTDGPTEEDKKDEFLQEQHLVAKSVHLIRSTDPSELFQIYCAARRHFGQSGVKRIRYTIVPLVFVALKLATQLVNEDETKKSSLSSRKVLQFVHENVTALASKFPTLAFKLFLQSAQCANDCNFESIAYEFFSQAFILFEEEMGDSKAQFQALQLLIGALMQCTRFDSTPNGNYDILISKAAHHAFKLLKKTDQSRCLVSCSHLFWHPTKEDGVCRDAKRVLECLQRALKSADASMATSSLNAGLFVEVLEKYVYHFEHRVPSIKIQYIDGLIALIQEHLSNIEDEDVKEKVEVHFANVLKHIRSRKQTPGDELSTSYATLSSVS